MSTLDAPAHADVPPDAVGVLPQAGPAGRGGAGAVRWTEVDGVPVAWVDAPGPMRAHLSLRAGWADEVLPTRGWTHLAEHLALSGVGRPGEHSNGHTGVTLTSFHVEGRPEEVVDWLSTVTGALSDLPLARLDAELGVLRAEEQRRGGSSYDGILSWRYGARDYGLSALAELGLSVRPDEEALRHFARTRAAAGNAVLWLSGPPPAGMRLHLGEGPHLAPPDPYRTVAGDLPAWTGGEDHQVTALAVVRRGWQAGALRHVVERRLVDVLRVGLAVAYSPSAVYDPMTADAGWLMLHTDLVGGRQSEGVGPFLRLLHDLGGQDEAAGAVTEAEVESFRAQVRRSHDDPYAWVGEVASAATDRLLRRARTPGEAGDVTVEQVRAAAREAAASLFAAVPRGLGTYRAPWSEAQATTVRRVHGAEHRALGSAETIARSVEGLSLVQEDAVWTVRRDSVAGVLRWPDGGRVLVGDDGVRVRVEPSLWEGGTALVEHVDAVFPAGVVVPMAPRPPGALPRPTSSVPGAPDVPSGPVTPFLQEHRWLALLLMLLGAAALLVLLGMLLSAAGLGFGLLGPASAGAVAGVVARWRSVYPRPRRR